MVAIFSSPVYTKGATTRSVYLPAGEWYDWWAKARVAGGRAIERARRTFP